MRAAIRKRDTAAVFDWLIAALSYQGISDQIAYDYMEQHGYVRWDDINQKLAQGADLPQAQELLAFLRLPLQQAQPDLRRARSHRPLSAADPRPAQRPPQPDRLFAVPVHSRHCRWRSDRLDRPAAAGGKRAGWSRPVGPHAGRRSSRRCAKSTASPTRC